MKLSKRLEQAVKRVNGKVAADIGCDHAFVICQAALNGQIEKGYACDNKPGPLNHAKKTIEETGTGNIVVPILSNGLEHIPTDCTQLIILGMGGELIAQILKDADGYDHLESLLLSPHKDPETLRRFLYENGWIIKEEKMVDDQGFYPLITAIKGTDGGLSETERYFGKNPAADADYRSYLEDVQRRLNGIIKEHPQAKERLQKKADLARSLYLQTFKKED